MPKGLVDQVLLVRVGLFLEFIKAHDYELLVCGQALVEVLLELGCHLLEVSLLVSAVLVVRVQSGEEALVKVPVGVVLLDEHSLFLLVVILALVGLLEDDHGL